MRCFREFAVCQHSQSKSTTRFFPSHTAISIECRLFRIIMCNFIRNIYTSSHSTFFQIVLNLIIVNNSTFRCHCKLCAEFDQIHVCQETANWAAISVWSEFSYFDPFFAIIQFPTSNLRILAMRVICEQPPDTLEWHAQPTSYWNNSALLLECSHCVYTRKSDVKILR